MGHGRLRFHSLRAKLMVPLLAAVLGGAAVGLLVIHGTISRKLEEGALGHARSLARAVMFAAETGDDLSSLQRFVTNLGAEPNVVSILVAAGPKPRVIAATKLALMGRPLVSLGQGTLARSMARVLRKGSGESLGESHSAGSFIYVAPLRVMDSRMGRARLERGVVSVSIDGHPTSLFLGALKQDLSLIQCLLLGFFGLYILVMFRRTVLGPLQGIVGTIQRYKQGEESARAPVESRDELGRLAGDLNAMLDTIAGKNLSLRNQNAKLQEVLGDLKVQARDLVEARNRAQVSRRAKRAFLATMSHEIRTPLNGILGAAELLLTDTAGRDERELLTETIKVSARALLHTMNDILDFCAVESGHEEACSSPFSPASLVCDVAQVLTYEASRKELEVRVAKTGLEDLRVLGDPARIRQVLLQLLANAIKFSGSGKIQLGLEMPDRARDPELLRFFVRDEGIGIPAAQLQHLFDAFRQGDDSFSRAYGGTGLGLATSSKLVKLMGGEIGVRSTPGKGSLFWFTLRLPPAGAQEEMAASQPEERPVPRGLKILLAEDNLINRKVAVRLLKKLGCLVHLAANGQEALDTHGKESFDLIFMDCQMPVLDGFEATRAIRAREKGAVHIPIIALTANALPGDREQCLEAGMDDFLSKPVTLKQIGVVLQRWSPRGDSVVVC